MRPPTGGPGRYPRQPNRGQVPQPAPPTRAQPDPPAARQSTGRAAPSAGVQKRLQAGRGTYVTGVDDDNALLALLGKRSAGQSALAGTHQGLRRANSDRTLGNRSGNPPAAGPQRRGPVVHGRKGSSSSGGSADSGGSFGSLHSAPDLSLQRRGRGAEGAGGKRPVPPGEQQRGRGGAQNNLYMNGNGIASAKTQGGRQQPAPQPPSARRPWYPPGRTDSTRWGRRHDSASACCASSCPPSNNTAPDRPAATRLDRILL